MSLSERSQDNSEGSSFDASFLEPSSAQKDSQPQSLRKVEMPSLSSAKHNRQFMGGLRQNDRLNALLEGNLNQDLEQRKRDRSANQGGLSLVQLIGNKNPRSISQDLRAKHTATPPD